MTGMLGLTLRTARANLTRSLLSALAVVLGVAFLSGSLMFTDGLAQAMTGRTVTGFVIPGKGWRVDADFDAAYLLGSRKLGKDLVTGRVDWFDVRDATFKALDDNDEHGWALTADWRHPFGDHLAVLVEVVHVESDRPSRAYVGDAPQQSQTMVQTALKFAF